MNGGGWRRCRDLYQIVIGKMVGDFEDWLIDDASSI